MESQFALDRASELMVTLQHLTMSMKSLDYLGIPLAAAYLDMAINNIHTELNAEHDGDRLLICDNVDFTIMDQMAVTLFANIKST
jgi:hypothetical protein